MTGRLSLCAIALDEQDLIGDMLASVAGLGAELVVGVDTRTTDSTRAVVGNFGGRIVDVDWRDDFSYARNLTLDAATGELVLVLDADERLTSAGVRAVRQVLNWRGDPLLALDGQRVTGFSFELAEMDLQGRRVGPTWSGPIRLFRRLRALRYSGVIHEKLVYMGEPTRETREAPFPRGPHIIHVGNDPGLYQRKDKDARNMHLLEQQLAADPLSAYAHFCIAQQHSSRGRIAQAIEHASLALDLPGPLLNLQRTELERFLAHHLAVSR